LIPVSVVAYLIWPTFTGTVLDIFQLIQADRLAGLMSLDFLYLLGNVFGIPLFIALYISLKSTDRSLSALALALGFIALVSLIPARPIFEMFFLSDQYAAASTDVQRTQLIAAGEAIMALFRGTAFQVHYIFGGASLLISSILMLRSYLFSKATAIVGIIANLLVFGLYIPEIGVYLSILSVFPFLMIWNIMLTQKFFQLSSNSRNS
jgi:hypothetical protein